MKKSEFNQLSLFNESFQADELYSRDKYILCEGNQDFVEYLLDLNRWSDNRFTILYGEKYSGKSHLSFISAEANDGLIINRYSHEKIYDDFFLRRYDYFVIDEINNFDEDVAFHLFNHLQLHKKYALFVTNKSINDFRLKDLKSRLSSIPMLQIDFLDKNLAYGILIKIFSDYEIVIDGQIIEYIVNHLDVSFSNIRIIVEAIKDLLFTTKEKISLNKIKKMIDGMKVTYT